MNAASAATIRVGQDSPRAIAAAAPLVPCQVVRSVRVNDPLECREAVVIQAMADALRARGWGLITPAEMAAREARQAALQRCRTSGETCTEFCARVGIHPQTLSKAWSHPKCPHIRRRYGQSGRNVRRLWPTPEFESWILRHKPRPHPPCPSLKPFPRPSGCSP